MVKDKYGVVFLFIVVLSILYVVFLYFDKKILKASRETFINSQIDVMKTSNQVHGIILGGSNVFYSLSAEIISKETNRNFIGVAIPSEGYSNNAYWEFIKNNLKDTKREDIKIVIYSPVTLFQDRKYILDRNKDNLNIFGEETELSFGNLIKPIKSFAGYLKTGFNNINNRYSNSYGDLDFSTVECDYNKVDVEYKRFDEFELFNSWFIGQFNNIRELFPNSKIFFNIPSMFYGDALNLEVDVRADGSLKRIVQKYNQNNNINIELIKNDYYPEKNMICDGIHHANEIGRIWRTNDLLQKIGIFKLQ